jgi:hypothetical protein
MLTQTTSEADLKPMVLRAINLVLMVRTTWRCAKEATASALNAFIETHICQEIPDEMSACGDCNTTRCSGENYRTCRMRLQQLEASRILKSLTTR